MRRVTLRLIKNRSGDTQNRFIAGRYSPVFWILASAAACGITAAFIPGPSVSSISSMCMMLILISLSAVDADIRKIPNSLLIALLAVKAAAIVIDGDFTQFIGALWGFGAGVLLFVVLTLLKTGIGMGDLKLIAAMGFCLGFVGLCQAVAVMGVAVGLYALMLIISKKGGLKTQAALAPPLSLGMAVTLLFPIAQALIK